MRIYLTARPEDLQAAAALPWELAHDAYRIGDGSALLSRDLLPSARSGTQRSGLLVLTDREAPPVNRPEALAEAVLRECGRRGFGGAVLDLEGPVRADLCRFAALLGQRCAAAHRTLYLPEPYAGGTGQGTVLINTAVSGGSLEEHIREAAARYGGPGRIALDIQRLRMAFDLPNRSGEGEPLSPEALDALLKDGPPTFFSRDLCARYFTRTEHGAARFILFDDAGTLRQKLRLGRRLGVAAAFFQWPEVRELAGELLG